MSDLEDYVRRGDYLIPHDTLEDAQRVFARRSPRSQAVDRGLKGTITADYDRWKQARGRGVDFPGVDTPTDHPTVGLADHLGARERVAVGAGRFDVGDALLVEQPGRATKKGVAYDTARYAVTGPWKGSGKLANILQPGSADDAY